MLRSVVYDSSKRMLPYWIAAALAAVVSIFYAKFFAFSEETALRWANGMPWLAFLVTPAAMLASASLALFVAPGAGGSGIPQLLAAVEVSRAPNPLTERLLGIRAIIVKLIGSGVCVAGGGVTGREGPTLQISAGLFHLMQKFWPDEKTRPNLQSMVLAGGAAGLASAFNTPLGGIIFAIEELAKVHVSVIRTYVFHAVIIAGLLAQAAMGNYLYLGKIALPAAGFGELVPAIAAAAAIGVLGAVFGRAIVGVLDWRSRRTAAGRLAMTAALGLAVASLSYLFGAQAMGSGRAVIIDILDHGERTAPLMLGVLRGFGNFLTYSGGVIGGVFAPALSTGAAFGSWASGFYDGSNHPLWALMGMTAFLTGVTRTPFTSLILVLEMTDAHDVVIPLMTAAIAAQSAARLVDPVSFYEHMSYRLIHGRAPPAAGPSPAAE